MARKNTVDYIHSALTEEESIKMMVLLKRKESPYYRLTKSELVRTLMEEAYMKVLKWTNSMKHWKIWLNI